ncbi:MAG: hypothetical protein LQ342_000941 [Letrouitia transgressa]|nr:MAG: hypothetical protein LQ342_000941 [Letrouitia transgressa]
MTTSASYKSIAADAQKRRNESLPQSYLLPPHYLKDLPRNVTAVATNARHFTTEELEIINSQAEDILIKVRERIWTAREVTEAFCKAATVAQQLTNCLTEILFSEAIDRAKYLDGYLARTGRTLGPFHGLPISLKDCFVTPPHPSSIGMASYANQSTAADDETLLVQILRDMGAVFYCKTNIPVAMMMIETINNVWGETCNPFHTGLSPGGSSGGESALLAMRGSPLGIGSDIGGSVRVPGAWCHLYSLKASAGRFPSWAIRSGIPGQEYIIAVNGPMARDLEALQLYCEHLLSENSAVWTKDPKCLPIPWRKNVIQPQSRRLRFGIIGNNDGLMTCHPPVERALHMTRKALERAGHEVIDWEPIHHPEVLEILMWGFGAFGSESILPQLEKTGEPIFNSMKMYREAAAKGENVLGSAKLREMNLKRNALQKAYLDRWQASATDAKGPIDGIIMAVSPWAAARLGVTQKLSYVGYTGLWNVLDLPSCTFPVMFADQKIDKERSAQTWKPLNERDGRVQADYDPIFYHGAPVSLQLIGRRLEEEKVLEMVEVVSQSLSNRSSLQ